MSAVIDIGEELKRTLDRGDVAAAIDACRVRLRSTPHDADAHRHLGQLLAMRGEFPAAYRSALRACELAPGDARCWSDCGRVYALEGHLDDAMRCFAEAVEIDPRCADGWHNLGTALKQLGSGQAALDAFKQALSIDPKRADTYLNLGNLLIEAEQFDDAVECFERAAKHDARLAVARSRLAHQLSIRGKVKRAETLFRQSVGLDPEHVQGWFGLGRALEDLGEEEGALGCYLNVIARRPEHANAIGQYLALVRQDAVPGIVELAKRKLADEATSNEARALIGYGLLKYHDRRKDYGAAADAGLRANQARRASAGPLDRAALTARVDGIVDTYTREFFAARKRYGAGTDQPVFIVGLPRSGTTLTEQVLSAHPLLHGAGELSDLARVAATCLDAGEQAWQSASKLDLMQSRTKALDYLKALRDGAPKGRLRISDKSPLNFFNLAFAAVLFPNARVIHCRREPRDNALSIWMENFNLEQRYATDFDDLAFFMSEYRRLMAHWREHLPLPILEIDYEHTVDDLEGQARRLTQFLGVPWDARCLEFHRSERAVQTPSRWQVRQPIYRKSVARWRSYLPYVEQLATAFPGVLSEAKGCDPISHLRSRQSLAQPSGTAEGRS